MIGQHLFKRESKSKNIRNGKTRLTESLPLSSLSEASSPSTLSSNLPEKTTHEFLARGCVGPPVVRVRMWVSKFEYPKQRILQSAAFRTAAKLSPVAGSLAGGRLAKILVIWKLRYQLLRGYYFNWRREKSNNWHKRETGEMRTSETMENGSITETCKLCSRISNWRQLKYVVIKFFGKIRNSIIL